jgi:RimJ/RimL family protein N-acetyltransferase
VERLRLRPPDLSDQPDYTALFLREEVQEWLRPPPLQPFAEAEVEELLAGDVKHWRQAEYGPWALIDPGSGEFVGRAGLHGTIVEGTHAIELAWTVDPDRQGQGLATEAARAAIELGRAARLRRLVALTLPGNRASRRVCEKIGMKAGREVDHAGLPHVLYVLDLA